MVSRGSRDKRILQWVTVFADWQNLAANGQTNLLIYNAIVQGARFIKGATVTRTLLKIWMSPDTLAERARMNWGLVLVNADARAAGAFPDADDLSDRAGWLARGLLQGRMSSLSDSSQWSTEVLDLRGQRILGNEEVEYHLIVDNPSGSIAFDWSAYIRVLMRMP